MFNTNTQEIIIEDGKILDYKSCGPQSLISVLVQTVNDHNEGTKHSTMGAMNTSKASKARRMRAGRQEVNPRNGGQPFERHPEAYTRLH